MKAPAAADTARHFKMPQDESATVSRNRPAEREIEKHDLGGDDRAPDDLTLPIAIGLLASREAPRRANGSAIQRCNSDVVRQQTRRRLPAPRSRRRHDGGAIRR